MLIYCFLEVEITCLRHVLDPCPDRILYAGYPLLLLLLSALTTTTSRTGPFTGRYLDCNRL